jgi:hypothetical protein
MKTSKTIRFWSLAMGVLTAAGILFSQFFFFGQQETFAKAEVEQHDATSDSEDGDQYISQPSFSQPVTASFVLQQELAVIQEILFGDHEPEESPVQLTLSTGKFFRALFQFIISPNAP